ncbi:restriction endonuclease [Citricoccus nitrophenolicus]|uniref:restriction endonuclease n=1 Tax=Citricoccus nitrophenolicus TaxID=863575 RepID=UPI0031E6DFB1
MSAPKWHEYMAPVLRALSDGLVYKPREAITAAADLMGVSEEQRSVLIASGQEQWINRGNWALSYLTRAGATERPGRAQYRITDVGRDLLARFPDGITERDLRIIPGYETPRRAKPAAAVVPVDLEAGEEDTDLDPDEQIASGIARIHADVADELLQRVLGQEPVFFEQAVLDLLIAMGYGGAEGKATRTQLSSDGGIDGIIDQDALGLSRVYVQAKRYAAANVVGRPAIQEFVGALAGNAANQGVFITTSRFSAEAQRYADQVPTRVVLVDGERLTRLMIHYGVGVQVKRTVQIVEIDEDFFE